MDKPNAGTRCTGVQRSINQAGTSVQEYRIQTAGREHAAGQTAREYFLFDTSESIVRQGHYFCVPVIAEWTVKAQGAYVDIEFQSQSDHRTRIAKLGCAGFKLFKP